MTVNDTIPPEMRRLVVTSSGSGNSVADCVVEVQTVPTPTPKFNEILIKVVAAPVNPSDYGGWYRPGPTTTYPLPMGKEGCGIVVASGGMTSSFKCPIGSKVGFIISDNMQGSYSEYVTVSALTGAFLMPADVPIEECASFFVNPYTAVGILDTAERANSSCKAIVHTAAASQLGQMLNKLASTKDMEIINIVRRPEQKELLEQLGAKHIIVTDGDDVETWKTELRSKVKELGVTHAFDAVSGEMTGHILDCMPSGGVVYLYGGLAGKASGINPLDLIYRRKQLKGFLLTSWLFEGGTMKMVRRMMSASGVVNAGLVENGWARSQFLDTTMEEAHAEIVRLLSSSSTGNKLRIRFDGAK
jgi:NADPH2:quinone reductase